MTYKPMPPKGPKTYVKGDTCFARLKPSANREKWQYLRSPMDVCTRLAEKKTTMVEGFEGLKGQ